MGSFHIHRGVSTLSKDIWCYIDDISIPKIIQIVEMPSLGVRVGIILLLDGLRGEVVVSFDDWGILRLGDENVVEIDFDCFCTHF
jgi:hypothetical protein